MKSFLHLIQKKKKDKKISETAGINKATKIKSIPQHILPDY